MAAVDSSHMEAADSLQKLTLDSQTKTLEVSEPSKKPSTIQYGPVDSSSLANGTAKPFEQSTTPIQLDPNASYFPNGYPTNTYYYGGYDGQGNEWNNYSRYVNPDVVEIPHGVYGDNGSMMYHQGYGYAPYGTYPPPGSPVPTMGHDAQMYGQQQYQYPSHYYQPPTSGPYTPNQSIGPQGEVSSSVAADQVPLSARTPKGNPNSLLNGGNVNGNNGPKPLRPSNQNSSLNEESSYGRGGLPTGIPSSGYSDPRFGFDGIRSQIPWLDASIVSDRQSKHATSAGFSSSVSYNNFQPGRNQSLRNLPNLMNLNHARPTSGLGQTYGFTNRLYPDNRMYGQSGNTFRAGTGFGSFGYESRTNGRDWLADGSKYKTRGRGVVSYGNENMDSLNELNRGPRAKGFKNQKGFGPITLAVKGQNLTLSENNKDDNLSLVQENEPYNREDLPENYSDAKFFVIKSYSEDDVHKSIKYGVWASTPNGNKKLDAAYQQAKEKSGGCPVFLLFSVNTSGQFVGLAEMVGPIDFNKTVEYWQQDKWDGCFPVKWHIIKDVPNSLLKHITLENNENKPVTNSRDTQEVKFEQGIQILKIFRGHLGKTSILDDFEFYEARQRTMQENKAKLQQGQKLVGDGKLNDGAVTNNKDKDGPTGKDRQQELSEAAALEKEPVTGEAAAALVKANGEVKLLEEHGAATAAEDDASNGSKHVQVSEKKVNSNGVARAC